MDARDDDSIALQPGLPPFAPESDELEGEDWFVDQYCRYLMANDRVTDFKIQKSLMTHSKKWGIVWRADYQFSGAENIDGVHRAVCWRNPNGKWIMQTQLGLKLDPL